MRLVKCLWHSCVDAYYFGLKEDNTWISDEVQWIDNCDQAFPDIHNVPGIACLYKEGYWYFDEIEQAHGPFPSYRKCIKDLHMYIQCLEGGLVVNGVKREI